MNQTDRTGVVIAEIDRQDVVLGRKVKLQQECPIDIRAYEVMEETRMRGYLEVYEQLESCKQG